VHLGTFENKFGKISLIYKSLMHMYITVFVT
jgi:hypothetical protein